MLWLIELIFGLVLDLFRSRAALARSTVWTPDAQADLIAAALKQMGVPRAIVLGHSLGTLVAVALALKYPQEVQAVILASGY
jgi:pimeloyl-ACP methyl ester carboxylesterase